MAVSTQKRGTSAPLGATATSDGVNFSVFSTSATAVELLLFDDARRARRLASARWTRASTAPITTGTCSLPTAGDGDPARPLARRRDCRRTRR